MWISLNGLTRYVPDFPGEYILSVNSPRDGDPNGNLFAEYPNNQWNTVNVTDFGVPTGAAAVDVFARLTISKGNVTQGHQTTSAIRKMGVTTEPQPWLWKARADGEENGTREDHSTITIPLVDDEFEWLWETSWNAASTNYPIGSAALFFVGYWI